MICFWDFLWLNLAYWFETFVNLPNYIPHCDAVIPKDKLKFQSLAKTTKKVNHVLMTFKDQLKNSFMMSVLQFF